MKMSLLTDQNVNGKQISVIILAIKNCICEVSLLRLWGTVFHFDYSTSWNDFFKVTLKYLCFFLFLVWTLQVLNFLTFIELLSSNWIAFVILIIFRLWGFHFDYSKSWNDFLQSYFEITLLIPFTCLDVESSYLPYLHSTTLL